MKTTVEIYSDGVFVNGYKIPKNSVKIETPVDGRPQCSITIYPDEIVVKKVKAPTVNDIDIIGEFAERVLTKIVENINGKSSDDVDIKNETSGDAYSIKERLESLLISYIDEYLAGIEDVQRSIMKILQIEKEAIDLCKIGVSCDGVHYRYAKFLKSFDEFSKALKLFASD